MSTVNKTPLYSIHAALRAKMVDFSGWRMPIHYSSIIEEHKAVRSRGGLFDVSHMGQIEIKGINGAALMSHIVPTDISSMDDGEIKYSFLLNDDGGIIDDLLIHAIGDNRFFLCVNAGNVKTDYEWIKSKESAFEGSIVENVSREYGMVALQGPDCVNMVKRALKVSLDTLPYYNFQLVTRDDSTLIVARTGYTGEDGFEFYCKWRETKDLWESFANVNGSGKFVPVGLGARDTLRMEMCYPLHGSDIDSSTTPLEAGLSFAVDLDKAGGFIGREALLRQKENGITKKLVGMVLKERAIARHGYDVYCGQERTGSVTSGTQSPTLGKGIAMAYVKPEHGSAGTMLEIDIRGRRVTAEVIKGSFVESHVRRDIKRETREDND